MSFQNLERANHTRITVSRRSSTCRRGRVVCVGKTSAVFGNAGSVEPGLAINVASGALYARKMPISTLFAKRVTQKNGFFGV